MPNSLMSCCTMKSCLLPGPRKGKGDVVLSYRTTFCREVCSSTCAISCHIVGQQQCKGEQSKAQVTDRQLPCHFLTFTMTSVARYDALLPRLMYPTKLYNNSCSDTCLWPPTCAQDMRADYLTKVCFAKVFGQHHQTTNAACIQGALKLCSVCKGFVKFAGCSIVT